MLMGQVTRPTVHRIREADGVDRAEGWPHLPRDQVFGAVFSYVPGQP